MLILRQIPHYMPFFLMVIPKFGPKKWQRMAVSLKEGQTVTEELWKGRAREGRETLERDVIR